MTELLISKWPMFSPPNVLCSLLGDDDDDYDNNGNDDGLVMMAITVMMMTRAKTMTTRKPTTRGRLTVTGVRLQFPRKLQSRSMPTSGRRRFIIQAKNDDQHYGVCGLGHGDLLASKVLSEQP